MSEKMIFYNVQKDLIYEDYFDIQLQDGRMFRWKNFGQSVTIGNEDLRKAQTNVVGAIIEKEEFEDIEVLSDFQWLVDAKEFGYGEEENMIYFNLPLDNIVLTLNTKYESRNADYPEGDYFYWVNEYPLYDEYKSRMGTDEEKTYTYLTNWRRPKLKTNALVKVVVWHNDVPVYVGMLDGDNKKSAIDAFFRMIYKLQFEYGEDDVR